MNIAYKEHIRLDVFEHFNRDHAVETACRQRRARHVVQYDPMNIAAALPKLPGYGGGDRQVQLARSAARIEEPADAGFMDSLIICQLDVTSDHGGVASGPSGLPSRLCAEASRHCVAVTRR